MGKLYYIIFLLVLLILGVIFIRNNVQKCKIQYFRFKYYNEIARLQVTYSEAKEKCLNEELSNRGVYVACLETNIKAISIISYKDFRKIQVFCESITTNLADEYLCIENLIP